MSEVRAESTWALALAHSTRVRILRRMLDAGSAAPAALAGWWDLDAGAVRRHFVRLRLLGVIESSPRGRRGDCRLRDRPSTQEALWRLGAPFPASGLPERLAANASSIEATRSHAIERLRVQREQLGLSQPAVARRAGIRPDLLGRIERRETDPRLQTVLVVANALDYPLERLFAPAAQAARCP
jgi:DNA-binding XRE family transcriptional regulator